MDASVSNCFCGSFAGSLLFLFRPAGVVTEDLAYQDGKVLLEGYLAYKEGKNLGKRPVVLIVHAWMGLGKYEKKQAQKLAELGYLAFAVDMYGKGVRAKTPQEAGKLVTIYRKDRKLMRQRVNASLSFIKKHPLADSRNIVAMGYCFGGGTVLELARSGASVKGVVSFHGNLDTPNSADAKNIKGKVLVLHGAEDPSVPPSKVAAFMKEMRDAGVDWYMVHYGKAVHAFTHGPKTKDKNARAAYNKKADQRSWQAPTEVWLLCDYFQKSMDRSPPHTASFWGDFSFFSP